MRPNPGRIAPLIACLVLASCDAGTTSGPQAPQADMPPLVVIVLIDDGPPSADLPWTLADGVPNVSTAMISRTPGSGEEPVHPGESIVREALEADMLVALIDAGDLPDGLARDHICITTGPDGTPSSTPQGIMETVPDSVWSDLALRQEWIGEMIRVYLPDLAVIGLRTPDRESMIGFLRGWTTPSMLADMNIVALRLPSETGPERGWAMLGGSGISGETPDGLTPGAVLSTMELMCGLDWESAVPERIPALDILLELPAGWSRE